jgi:intracellular septation protein A
MLVPLVLFYAALWALGPTGAICAALAWNYLALLRRIWRRERLPGVLLIATLGLTARSVLALASGNSLFVYFLQPSLATALLGGAFLLSVPLGRPLAEKLAHDFVPLPAWFVTRPRVHKLFVRISLLWALVSLSGRKDGPICFPHIGRDSRFVLVVPTRHPPLRAGPRTGRLTRAV